VTHWCPFCWAETFESALRCDDCGAALRGLSYTQKLALALRHPIRDHRMMAAEALGRLRASEAVPELVRALDRETDFYFLREILRALAAISTTESLAAIQGATQHDSRLVARAAREQLETRTPTQGAER
jgi:HEAT repeat protein